MQVSADKVERYRIAANKYGELAKSAEPAYLGNVYRRVAVRYVFMAEELSRQLERSREAVASSAGRS
jgi:hypothetical protein